MFENYLGVIDAVALLGVNATCGNVQKMNINRTRGQVERLLKGLVGEGYMERVSVPYGGTGKIIYSVTNRCQTNFGIVNSAVDNVEIMAGAQV